MAEAKQHTSIFDRLTDTKLYTGAHKHRFDDNGNGRGLAGRDRIAKGGGHIAGAPGGAGVKDLSQITRTNLHTTGAGYAAPASRGPSSNIAMLYARTSFDGSKGLPGPVSPTGPTTPSPRPISASRNVMRTSYSGVGSAYKPVVKTTTTIAAGRTSDAGQKKTSIFDRLNDPSSYTGAHRARFSADGRGRGAEGRTTPNAYVSPMDVVRR